MVNRLRTYSDEHGLSRYKAGEALLSAVATPSTIGVCIDDEELEKIGITPGDNKRNVVRKIEAAIKSADSPEILECFSGRDLEAENPEEEEVVKMSAERIRHELEKILSWLRDE